MRFDSTLDDVKIFASRANLHAGHVDAEFQRVSTSSAQRDGFGGDDGIAAIHEKAAFARDATRVDLASPDHLRSRESKRLVPQGSPL